MGHSYGGVTSIYTAYQEKERIAGIISLDPWLWPIPENFLN